jgi:hypothetical protein
LVSAGDCSKSGYEYCYQKTNNDWPPSYSHAQVYFSLSDEGSDTSRWKQGYAVGSLFAKVGYEGDKLYFAEGLTDWNKLNCNENGCSSSSGTIKKINSGTVILANQGQTYSSCPAFVAHDYDEDDGYWSWVYAGYGWVGSNCLNIKIVECYDNDDCIGNQICDESGSWSSWNCKVPECQPNEEKCESTTYYTCTSDYTWGSQGEVIGKCGIECKTGNKCEGATYYECENYKWLNKGVDREKCVVECVDDSECPGDEVLNSQCVEKNLISQVKQYKCEDFVCVNTISDTTTECVNDCKDGKCTWGNIDLKIIIGVGVVAIILIVGYVYYVKRKRRKRS